MGRQRYSPLYDINGDGKVSGQDLLIVVRQLGKRC